MVICSPFFHLVNRLEPLPLAIQKNDDYYYVRKTTQNAVLLSVPFFIFGNSLPTHFPLMGSESKGIQQESRILFKIMPLNIYHDIERGRRG